MKKWYQSKTLWFGLALDVLGVVQLNQEYLSAMLSPKMLGFAIIGVGVLVKLLRFATTTAITDAK